jgi:LytS/YehU family sensor histidine kinase
MKYLLYVKEYEQTGKYLDSFSKMIRHTLHYSEKTFISIEEEMAYLSLYLSMEELRFRGHFSYEISCTPSVKITHKIPSLLIQPFVENALKHGVASLEDRNGHVQVLFDQNPQELIITITDNGNGILEDNYPTDKSESFGIKLSQKRVETFKLLFETKINLEIINQNASGQQGTQVKIRIKKEEHEN